MFERSRLIPAVILGAVGLLALKAISWTNLSFVPLAEQVAPKTARVNPDGTYDPAQFRGVVQMWARAREPYVIPSPEVTGSVEKKDEKRDAAQPQQPMPPEASIRDRAQVMNSGQRAMSQSERALPNGSASAARRSRPANATSTCARSSWRPPSASWTGASAN